MTDWKRAYLWAIEPLLLRGEGPSVELVRDLRRARLNVLPEIWVVAAWVVPALVAVLGGILGLVLPIGEFGWTRAAIAVGIGFSLFLIVRSGFSLYPKVVSTSLGRRIDAEFPSVVTLCYALARGGVGAVDTFRTVASEKGSYGEIADEFNLIIREVDVFGQDALTAVHDVAQTSPSKSLRAFLEGLFTVMKSGAEPRSYFRRQAEMQLMNAERDMERDLDQVSLLAEVYVSGLLVLPLLLIVVVSVLATLGDSGMNYIPIMVFGVIPLGTMAYVVLLDTLLPGDPLDLPKPPAPPLDDFGLDTYPSNHSRVKPEKPAPSNILSDDDVGGELPRARMKRGRETAMERIVNGLKAGAKSIVETPEGAATAAFVAGVLTFAVGFVMVSQDGTAGRDFTVALTGVIVTAAVAASIPAIAFHETRVHRAGAIDRDLPEALGSLASFNDRGLSLLRAFEIIGRAITGRVGAAFRDVARDVSWNGNMGTALRRLRARARSRNLVKLSVLFEHASRATGNLREVLDVAAQEASKKGALRTRQRQSMMSYVVVIYVVFAVFLYVIIMVAKLFLGDMDLGQAAASATTQTASLGKGIDAAASRITFLHAVLVQGAAAGMVAGKLGEGYIMSGIKHSAILMLIGWVAFDMGVGI